MSRNGPTFLTVSIGYWYDFFNYDIYGIMMYRCNKLFSIVTKGKNKKDILHVAIDVKLVQQIEYQ